MLNKIRFALQGAAALTLMGINTMVLALLIFVLGVLKLVAPPGVARQLLSRWSATLGAVWSSINRAVLWCYRSTTWDISVPPDLSPNGRYLVLCNHQSWVDILVLQHGLIWRAPFMRFMLKRQLMWVPFLGMAWWALDMPFLRRYSRQELLKKPNLRGKDLENAARACEKLQHIPVSMMSFPEGTRFTPAKHQQQKSSYPHLLLPRYGGIGQVLYSFGDALQTVIDVTIFYPDGIPTFWQLVSGQVRKIVMVAQKRTIPAELRGIDFRQDRVANRQLKHWLNDLWVEKEHWLEAAHAEVTRERVPPPN